MPEIRFEGLRPRLEQDVTNLECGVVEDRTSWLADQKTRALQHLILRNFAKPLYQGLGFRFLFGR